MSTIFWVLSCWPKSNCVFFCANKRRIFMRNKNFIDILTILFDYLLPSFGATSRLRVQKSSYLFRLSKKVPATIWYPPFNKWNFQTNSDTSLKVVWRLLQPSTSRITFYELARRFFSFSESGNGKIWRKCFSFGFRFWNRRDRAFSFSKTSFDNQVSDYAINLRSEMKLVTF